VLLDVHPDYVNLEDGLKGNGEYPVALYAEFLLHISQRFKEQYWEAKPNQVAEWYKASRGSSRSQGEPSTISIPAKVAGADAYATNTDEIGAVQGKCAGRVLMLV